MGKVMFEQDFIDRTMQEVGSFLSEPNAYRSILILIGSVLVSYWLSRFVAQLIIFIAQKVAVRSDNESNALKALRLRQVETYLGVTVAVVRVVIVAVVAYLVWRMLSPEGSRQLGGSGAAAIGASAVFIVVASQTAGPLLRDITAGAVIIIERWFTVGDYIKVESFWNVTGVVERLTLRSTKLRSLSGEVIWIHNQKIDAVHVTPNGVRTLAVDVLVNDKELGEKLVKNTIAKLPTGPMMIAERLRIVETAKWSDELWMMTVQGKTVPGREWLIENYFVSELQKENARVQKKNRALASDPIVRYADPDTERRFRRAVRVQQSK
ncbi:MAG TPA: mechanosensitive ion channel [Candidatus Saccharibacteria bacterium]|nr:mechanosensitive ion channel [Candidatus Saccharibacteria bacterium]HRK94265.1 mechanosensitive ion channel [Candidatus Saccharibacteria bacterium]